MCVYVCVLVCVCARVYVCSYFIWEDIYTELFWEEKKTCALSDLLPSDPFLAFPLLWYLLQSS